MKPINMELWRGITEQSHQYNISILESALNQKNETELEVLIMSIVAEHKRINQVLSDYTERGLYSIVDRDTMLRALTNAMHLIHEFQEESEEQAVLAALADTKRVTVDAVIDYIIFAAAITEFLPNEWVKAMELNAVNHYVVLAKKSINLN